MSDKPTIFRMLDASTGHLPADVRENLNGYEGVIATERKYGWLLWVPEDTQERVEEYPDTPASVAALWRVANDNDCQYVLLDADADEVDGLPMYSDYE
jgi:hypothetical protein